MAKTQSKSGLIVTIVILGITLLVVGGIVVLKNTDKSSTTPTTSTKVTPTTTKDAATTETDDLDKASTSTSPAGETADPTTLSSIDVEPMGITVSYTKGIPGFEFAVKKTTDRTQYVEFTSTDLVGTKCTDDEGLIVSILKNPTSSESQTVSQTVKVGADTYGLSLASKGCTGDAELLDEYQAAFTNGFTSLKAL